MVKSAKEIISFYEQFSELKKVDEDNLVEFVEHVALSYKLFILKSFSIPLDKKSIYDKKLAEIVYDFVRKLYVKLSTEDQGIELMQRYYDSMPIISLRLGEMVSPYSLQFKSLKFPKTIMSRFKYNDL